LTGDPVLRGGIRRKGRCLLDHPLEPVIGLAEGETRWRVMTSCCFSSFRGARKRESGISQGNIQIPGLRLRRIPE
jgi:hypothetical protein